MTTTRSAGLAVLLAIPLVGFAACERQPVPEAQQQTEATEQRSDTWITTSVQAQLYTEDAIRGRDVDVSTSNGVVTLRGRVESDADKQRAISIAQGVDGVARVDDQLSVEPAQTAQTDLPDDAPSERVGTTGVDAERRSPSWIRTQIQARYFTARGVSPWDIDVTTTSDGVVELEGEVETAEDKAEAVRIARETEGVTRVEDNLRVRADRQDADAAAGTEAQRDDTRAEGGVDHPDAWLTTKVQSKYFLDADVRGRNIDVTTRDGIVTLRGTVESAHERRQAVALARNTDGVRDVRDELQVVSAADAGGARQQQPRGAARTGTRDAVNDTWITTKIQAQYFLDQNVSGRQVDVDTRNGVVTLTGSVESELEKQAAEEIAGETDGVSRVVNQLVVAPQRG